ncbi:MAG: hypothetical protein AB7I41_14770 [Candidatus Sericytochromatia bacterium]
MVQVGPGTPVVRPQTTSPTPPPAAPTLGARPGNVAFSPSFTAPPAPTDTNSTRPEVTRAAQSDPVSPAARFNPETETDTDPDDNWRTSGTALFGDVTFDNAGTSTSGGESSTTRVGGVVGFMAASEGGNAEDTEYDSQLLYAGAGFESTTAQSGTTETETTGVRVQLGGRMINADGEGASGMGRRLDAAATPFAQSLRPSTGGN